MVVLIDHRHLGTILSEWELDPDRLGEFGRVTLGHRPDPSRRFALLTQILDDVPLVFE